MVDFSAPSFSLGLDLDSDPLTEDEHEEEEEPKLPLSTINARPSAGGSHPFVAEEVVDEEEENFDSLPVEDEPPDPAPVLKRLRRCPPVPRPPAVSSCQPSTTGGGGGGEGPVGGGNIGSFGSPYLDDDIEEFSSQEDCRILDAPSSKQNHSVCGSSSKLSLHGRRVLTTQSVNKVKSSHSTPLSNASSLIDLETGSNKKKLPKLTISPLRRIQFVDSDSDDPSPCKETQKANKEDKSLQRNRWSNHSQNVTRSQVKKAKISSDKHQTESFWKDFSPKKSVFTTPALDAFCEEYSNSMKGPDAGHSKEGQVGITCSRVFGPDYSINVSDSHQTDHISNTAEHNWSQEDPQPPSYRYFFHDDMRIRKFVRERLANFVPLGSTYLGGNGHSEEETLDYMCQFGPREGPSQASGAGEKGPGKTARNRKRNQGSANAKEPLNASGDWVNPRNCSLYQKNSGERRSNLSGHWYTEQDGRKVYITKNGQELSGRAAYQHYRKESGAGFRKSKKKTAPKKVKSKR